MKRDPLFFRLFKELPGCFFHLVGRSAADAQRYALEAIEYKATSVRLDGVFRPLQPVGQPAYLWEAQFYASETVYANLLSKIGRFLEHGNPEQDWVAVVIYPNRELEQKNLHPYRCLLESDQLVRIYLDELPPAPPDQFELGILELIAAQPETALKKAQAMVPRLRASKQPRQFQRMLLQLIGVQLKRQHGFLTLPPSASSVDWSIPCGVVPSSGERDFAVQTSSQTFASRRSVRCSAGGVTPLPCAGPPHTGTVETLADQVTHRTFHLAGGDHQVLRHPHAVLQHR